MGTAAEIRMGNVIRVNGKPCKVIASEIRGTAKFGKTLHFKLKSLEDGHSLEASYKAEDLVESLGVHRTKMQFLYQETDDLIFMNLEDYEQYRVPQKAVGKQITFLKENMEVEVQFVEGKPLGIEFPKMVELKVANTPPGVKGQSDTTYKEAELENGLKILVPQFIRAGEVVRVNTEDLSYLDRVTTKSL